MAEEPWPLAAECHTFSLAGLPAPPPAPLPSRTRCRAPSVLPQVASLAAPPAQLCCVVIPFPSWVEIGDVLFCVMASVSLHCARFSSKLQARTSAGTLRNGGPSPGRWVARGAGRNLATSLRVRVLVRVLLGGAVPMVRETFPPVHAPHLQTVGLPQRAGRGPWGLQTRLSALGLTREAREDLGEFPHLGTGLQDLAGRFFSDQSLQWFLRRKAL